MEQIAIDLVIKFYLTGEPKSSLRSHYYLKIESGLARGALAIKPSTSKQLPEVLSQIILLYKGSLMGGNVALNRGKGLLCFNN